MAELSEKSFPFDSEEINGEWDREYVADDFARYFRSFISSGVFMRTSSNLQVIANGDMTVTLKPGALMVDGYRYDAENDIVIQLDPADGVLNRIDRISGTWSKADRDIHFTLQKGAPSYEPLPATLRRTAEYKDYVFADIYVAAGAISIKQTDITDQRLNTEVCGLATPFAEFDTTTLYKKIEAYYAEMQARTENWTQEEKEKFTTWFDDIKNQLAGDVAANLQLQIGTLDALKTKNKSNLVAAINEVNEKDVDVLDTREEIQANTTAGKVAGALPVKELYSSLLKMQSGKIVSGCIPHNNNKKFNISFEGFSAIPIILCNAISLGYAGDMTFQGATNVTRNSATIRIDNTFSADINLDGTQRYVEWVAIGI